MPGPRKINVAAWKADDFREGWGPDCTSALAEEVDREVVRTLLGDAHEPGVGVVDELAAIARWPHLPPILRRFANGATDYDRDALHEAIHRYVRPWVRQFEVVRSDIEDTIRSALTRAAWGKMTPDLHNRVLELLHECGPDPEFAWRRLDYDIQLRSEQITAKPRKLGIYNPSPPEPSAVDRLAAQVDGNAAKRVAKMDVAIAHQNEAVDELRALWAPESPESDWGP